MVDFGGGFNGLALDHVFFIRFLLFANHKNNCRALLIVVFQRYFVPVFVAIRSHCFHSVRCCGNVLWGIQWEIIVSCCVHLCFFVDNQGWSSSSNGKLTCSWVVFCVIQGFASFIVFNIYGCRSYTCKGPINLPALVAYPFVRYTVIWCATQLW